MVLTLVLYIVYYIQIFQTIDLHTAYISRTLVHKQKHSNLYQPPSEIVWSHATNSIALLNRALNGTGPVDFIEFDIVFDSVLQIPIIGHSTQDAKNLTVSDFMAHFILLNTQDDSSIKHRVIGLKIDFKDTKAVQPVISIVKNTQRENWHMFSSIPILLNADILQGPGGKTPLFVPHTFIDQCQNSGVKNVGISIGWTTEWSVWTVIYMHQYTHQHIDEALHTVAKIHDTIPVTFCIRATIFKDSDKLLIQHLVHNRHTLTMWGETSTQERLAIAKSPFYHVTYTDIKAPAWYLICTVLVRFFLLFVLVVGFILLFEIQRQTHYYTMYIEHNHHTPVYTSLIDQKSVCIRDVDVFRRDSTATAMNENDMENRI